MLADFGDQEVLEFADGVVVLGAFGEDFLHLPVGEGAVHTQQICQPSSLLGVVGDAIAF